jgi:S1-C subfamily serine protease
MSEKPTFALQVGVLTVLVGGLLLIIRIAPPIPDAQPPHTEANVSSVAATATSSSVLVAPAESTSTSPIATVSPATEPSAEQPEPPAPEAPVATPSNPNEVRRIANPYPTNPLSFEHVNVIARMSLVNILCIPKGGSFRPISGSGVILDPRGVILTNAHVAQYVLLAESGRTNLQCSVRTGSPASAKWRAHVLFIPPVWVHEHASELMRDRPVGTGKHDYALLYIGSPLDGGPRPVSFPSVFPDTREAIGFVDDSVLTASYPAEFLGAITTSMSLYPVTSITRIDELFTLDRSSVDVISIGSVIGAQSGSSGGAIVNAWGRLIGVITTTSEGNTTGERRLRGITLSYIDRDLVAQTGSSLSQTLAMDPAVLTANFWSDVAPQLVEKLLAQLK